MRWYTHGPVLKTLCDTLHLTITISLLFIIHAVVVCFIGPGTYDPSVTAIQDKGGKMIYKENRFKTEFKEDVPGPGTYEVHKLANNTSLN